MQVRVLFFGILKDVVGRAEEGVELPAGSDVGSLLAYYAEQFPEFVRHRESLLLSRNREFVNPSELLQEGDEVALLPPVSGGVPENAGVAGAVGQQRREEVLCRLTRQPIDAAALAAELQRAADGAVVIFEGVVRDHSRGKTTLYLEYEAYEPMAVEKMRQIGERLRAELPIGRIGMVHRLGRLEIGEVSVAVVVTAEHRRAAFDACREAMDRLKRIVPIWKKEYFADGAVWAEGEGKPGGGESSAGRGGNPNREVMRDERG